VQTQSAFSETERKALTLLLQNENVKPFADENGIMPEVLVDSLNEKALDLIGDNIIDDNFNLYDDYIESVRELI
jgi:hypothetical protein